MCFVLFRYQSINTLYFIRGVKYRRCLTRALLQVQCILLSQILCFSSHWQNCMSSDKVRAQNRRAQVVLPPLQTHTIYAHITHTPTHTNTLRDEQLSVNLCSVFCQSLKKMWYSTERFLMHMNNNSLFNLYTC